MTKRGLTSAKQHAKKADSLWRRHKTRAAFFACLALAELTVWAAHRVAVWARSEARVRLQRYELELKGR